MTRTRAARAFTLVEVTITVALVGILAGLAFFAYRHFVGSGQDADARERLLAVASAQTRMASQSGAYTDDPAGFTPVASGADLVSGDSANPDEVSAGIGTRGNLGLAIRSASGECLYLRVTPLLAGGDPIDVTAAGDPCNGAAALDTAAGEVPAP